MHLFFLSYVAFFLGLELGNSMEENLESLGDLVGVVCNPFSLESSSALLFTTENGMVDCLDFDIIINFDTIKIDPTLRRLFPL